MTKTNEITIESLAAEASLFFTDGPRVSEDTGRTIRILKDDAPEWVQDLVYSAHGDMGPDDIRYDWTEDALSAIEQDGESAELEPDIYTSDLTRWLASRTDRFSYCDEAASEGYVGEGAGLIERLQAGQAMEQREIMAAVLEALNEELERREEAVEDKETDGDE